MLFSIYEKSDLKNPTNRALDFKSHIFNLLGKPKEERGNVNQMLSLLVKHKLKKYIYICQTVLIRGKSVFLKILYFCLSQLSVSMCS